MSSAPSMFGQFPDSKRSQITSQLTEPTPPRATNITSVPLVAWEPGTHLTLLRKPFWKTKSHEREHNRSSRVLKTNARRINQKIPLDEEISRIQKEGDSVAEKMEAVKKLWRQYRISVEQYQAHSYQFAEDNARRTLELAGIDAKSKELEIEHEAWHSDHDAEWKAKFDELENAVVEAERLLVESRRLIDDDIKWYYDNKDSSS